MINQPFAKNCAYTFEKSYIILNCLTSKVLFLFYPKFITHRDLWWINEDRNTLWLFNVLNLKYLALLSKHWLSNTLRTQRAIKMKACCILASTELDVPKEQAQGPKVFLSLNSNKKKKITAIRLHSPSVFSQRTQTQHYKCRRGTHLLTSDYLHSYIKVDFSLNLSLYPMGMS